MIRTVSRDCAGCTRCCEGHLWGEAYGSQFRPGQACAFLRGGCSIYPIRPDNPCRSFVCGWKSNTMIPQWLWPRTSGVIILQRKIKDTDHEYLLVVPAGGTITDKVREWAQQHGAQHQPVVLQGPAGIEVMAPKEFHKHWHSQRPETTKQSALSASMTDVRVGILVKHMVDKQLGI